MDQATFLHTVRTGLGCDESRAETVTLVVFQELRNRITPKEAADAAAQLPTGLRKLWLDGEDPKRQVARIHRGEFVGRVRMRAVLPDDAEGERVVKVVFHALQLALGSPHGTEGEAWDILSQLPKDMKELWLAAAKP
jgi:uncharacterized protein (DUF2267 family)